MPAAVAVYFLLGAAALGSEARAQRRWRRAVAAGRRVRAPRAQAAAWLVLVLAAVAATITRGWTLGVLLLAPATLIPFQGR